MRHLLPRYTDRVYSYSFTQHFRIETSSIRTPPGTPLSKICPAVVICALLAGRKTISEKHYNFVLHELHSQLVPDYLHVASASYLAYSHFVCSLKPARLTVASSSLPSRVLIAIIRGHATRPVRSLSLPDTVTARFLKLIQLPGHS
jgi:hypothetical protein